MQSPPDTTEREQYRLRGRDVSNDPAVGGERPLSEGRGAEHCAGVVGALVEDLTGVSVVMAKGDDDSPTGDRAVAVRGHRRRTAGS